MNNILTAKEWLEEEISIWHSTYTPSTTIDKPDLESLIERYASYRTKELEAKIMQFRVKLSNNVCDQIKPLFEVTLKHPSDEIINFAINNFKHSISLKEFDKHFNITSETKGRVD